jgi:hypothetical protein
MRIFLGLGAVSLVAVGCLLANPVSRLEGSPLEGQSGASGGGSTSAGSGGAGPSDAEAAEADVGTVSTRPLPMLFRVSNGGIPRGIALSDTGVYWAEVKPVGILYAPKNAPSDAAPAVIHVDTNNDHLDDVFDVAVDQTSLYWTEYRLGVVHKKPLAGTILDTSYFNGAGHGAYLTLTGDSHVYLTDFNMVIAAIVQGPPSLSVANNQKPPASGIAFCGDSIFWAWGNPSIIATADSTSMLPTDYYTPSDPGAITGLACDTDNFYWIQDNRSIRWTDRVQREREEPLYTSDSDFATDTDVNVADLAVDDEWIYFTKPLDRAIYRLAKPPKRDR